jgi:hypothetical protein
MDQKLSWEAETRTTVQEISYLLWNPEVHYRIQNSPPLDLILSHLNPVHDFTHYFFKTWIILQSTPWSSECSLSCNTFLCLCLSSTCYMSRPSHRFMFSEDSLKQKHVSNMRVARQCFYFHANMVYNREKAQGLIHVRRKNKKISCKVKLSLCFYFNEYHAMKAYGGVEL